MFRWSVLNDIITDITVTTASYRVIATRGDTPTVENQESYLINYHHDKVI